MIQIFGTIKNFDVKTAQRWFVERRIPVQFVDLKKKEIRPVKALTRPFAGFLKIIYPA